MSKPNIRARQLDVAKPLSIYRVEELPDLQDAAVNRAVAPIPSGMKKKEECEHHLQRAIVTGLIIPTPEVEVIEDEAVYDRLYPPNYKPTRQLIHMQPFSMEEDIPDYDIDSDDEKWLSRQNLDITPLKFEEMMDKLEKNCAQNFASQNREELLLKDSDELSIAVFDYWLGKRLQTKLPLVPTVRTEINNRGPGSNDNNPYLAFRRRTDKMQTRKNRKSDETSYEKMWKLKHDLSRALQLLEMVKRRETAKKEFASLTVQLYEKRYEAQDFNGALLAEVSTYKTARPAFAPIYTNQYTVSNHSSWPMKPPRDDVGTSRKEKRHYKKRKHKTVPYSTGERSSMPHVNRGMTGNLSSGEDDTLANIIASPPSSPKTAFPFLRNVNCSYQAAKSGGSIGNWNWTSPEEGGSGDERFRFSLASVSKPKSTCVGLVRRRIGRGGRIVLDRAGPSMDDFWSSVDFTVWDSSKEAQDDKKEVQPPPFEYKRHFRPKTPPSPKSEQEDSEQDSLLQGSIMSLNVQSLVDNETTPVDLDLGDLFPDLELDDIRNEFNGKRPRKGGGGSPEYYSPTDGMSEFSITDESWRGSNNSNTSTQTWIPVPMINHKLPPPPSSTETVLCDRVPPIMANGPINHNDNGGWGQQQTSSSPTVFKWNSNNSEVQVTSSNQATVINTKITAKNSTPLNNDTVGSNKRQGNGGQNSILHSTPMEVT